MLDESARRGIVRVADADRLYRGTAFFVSPRFALTCNHVVRGLERDQVWLTGYWPGGHSVAPANIHRHETDDLAVLEVGEPDRVAGPLGTNPVWLVPGLDVRLCGYSGTHSALEERSFRVAAWESAAGMYSVQNKAA